MSQHPLQKEYASNAVRTVALIGHGGSGKTSFAEAALYATGATNRQGKVDDGSSVSDYHQDEIERHISINTSLLVTDLDATKVNILDTPGYTDFTGEVKAALRVSDAAIVFVKAFEGVEVGTEIVWKYIEEYSLPSLFVITKVDHDNIDFERTVNAIKDRCSHDAVLVTFPVSTGPGITGVVDVLSMKLLKFEPSTNGKFTEEAVPAELQERATHLHEELIEKIAESDEMLLNKFFENGTLSEEDIRVGLKRGIVERKVFPIFSASPVINIGVLNTLNFIVKYCPSPLEHGHG
ncbi:MAG: GTP-binding protein, partial [Bacteroidota bacterium]